MTPSASLIDEIEDALATKTEEKREAALWRITDLFIEGSDKTMPRTTSRCSMT